MRKTATVREPCGTVAGWDYRSQNLDISSEPLGKGSMGLIEFGRSVSLRCVLNPRTPLQPGKDPQ